MKLSIITINYNNCDGLRKTIESVVNQTYRDFEYIIIDGGSTDGSVEVIKEYADRISYWISEPDNGIYHAMNKGVSAANGKYCLFLNSEDTLHENIVVQNITKVLDIDIDIIIGRILFTDTKQLSEPIESISMLRLYTNSLPHPASFISRELLLKYPYDENLKIVSDWKFYIQTLILSDATYKYIDVIITDFAPNGISGSNKAVCDAERNKVLKELIPQRIRTDYLQFSQGNGYKENEYDMLFINLRKYNYSPHIYTLCNLILRFIAIFKKSARFSFSYPILLNKKKKK